ncbi:MAG: hypothetical protein R3A10_19530 [Caldilineaceae bacterium]
MRNRGDTQIWLDIGSSGCGNGSISRSLHLVARLTWPPQEIWGDFHEYRMRQDIMRRCS